MLVEILPDVDGEGALVLRLLDTDKDRRANQIGVIFDSLGIHFRTRSVLPNPTISKRSLMPEGVIEGFSENQVADLFSNLISLK